MTCGICFGEHPNEAEVLLALIVNYVTARRDRETYVQNHTGETMRGVDLAIAEDAAWAALVAEAERG